jgi:hypothetical protein
LKIYVPRNKYYLSGKVGSCYLLLPIFQTKIRTNARCIAVRPCLTMSDIVCSILLYIAHVRYFIVGAPSGVLCASYLFWPHHRSASQDDSWLDQLVLGQKNMMFTVSGGRVVRSLTRRRRRMLLSYCTKVSIRIQPTTISQQTKYDTCKVSQPDGCSSRDTAPTARVARVAHHHHHHHHLHPHDNTVVVGPW